MRKKILTVLAIGAAMCASTVPAAAINSYNATPAPERTEVGAFMALWDNTGDGVPDRFDWVCSGTMVDRDTYLTAAHCTDDWPAGTKFYVSLDQDVQTLLDNAAAQGLTPAQTAASFVTNHHAVEGDTHQDPAYPGTSADAHDIGVIDFANRATDPADVWSFTPATLPSAGQLDKLGSRALDAASWLVVGYGTQEAVNGPGGQTHPGGGVRMKAPVDFDALNKTWVRLAMTAPQGNGGACYGDSGGPNFVTLNGKRVLAATTITGDTPCYATNVVYRTDTQSARSFLAPYVKLP
ncbi:trypsin [Kribbella sp. VKM Ac-2569]|uniref:trypsin-like serine protease n=1 Tax=Kribbella sp. VKM Ac-2569 TaxID=2512220 RepID=UPI00102B4FEB|nr:trypsin-like serine protease [Kribbella sp. VKM Ac-2569]RZT26511.1 trypsin [Kribbella sp. VKM Ac-2569]